MTRSKQRVTKMILQSVFVQTLKTEYMNICKYLHLINAVFLSLSAPDRSYPAIQKPEGYKLSVGISRCLFNSIRHLNYAALVSCTYHLILLTETQLRTHMFWEKLRTVVQEQSRYFSLQRAGSWKRIKAMKCILLSNPLLSGRRDSTACTITIFLSLTCFYLPRLHSVLSISLQQNVRL